MGRGSVTYNLNWFLGLTAALFLAIGPALAPALSLSSKNTIEICTAFGVLKIAVEGDHVPGQEDQNHKNNPGHCVFCDLRKLALLPPEPPSLPTPAVFSLSTPELFTIRLAEQSSSRPYQSRAPPSLLS